MLECSMHHQSLRHQDSGPKHVLRPYSTSRAWSHAFGSVPRARCCLAWTRPPWTPIVSLRLGRHGVMFSTSQKRQDAEPCLVLARWLQLRMRLFLQVNPSSCPITSSLVQAHRSLAVIGQMFRFYRWDGLGGGSAARNAVCTPKS